jgi:signal transduction histidine kinase
MKQRLRLDGVDHDVDDLSPEARQILERLRFVQRRLQELHNRQAMLTKAKNAYIADLKAELLNPVAGPHGPAAEDMALPAFLRGDDTDIF